MTQPASIADSIDGALASTVELWNRLPIAARLVVGLALLVVIGTLLLLLPGVATRPLGLDEALFTAVSALSVTGLSLITPSQDLTTFGQFVLLCLIQIGGVGFMAVAAVILRVLGRRVSLHDRLALTDSFGLATNRAILRVLGRILLGVIAIESIGAVLLWLHWRAWLGDGRAAFYAAFHAVSAFCNAGFDLFAGMPGYVGLPTDTLTLTIVGALIVLGGLGFPVIGEFVYWRGRLSLHSKITLAMAVILIVLGGLAIFLAEREPGGTLRDAAPLEALRLSVFQSVATRTAGFSALPDFTQLTPATQLVMTSLMFIGSAPASMGGGITTGTLAVLALTMWGYARGWPAARIGGRSVSAEATRRASAILTLSIFAVGLVTWLMLVTQQATLDDALFTVVSAFATTGLSLELTTEANFFGQALLMLMMFWGRLGALTIVVALARRKPPQPVYYPEEQLLIG